MDIAQLIAARRAERDGLVAQREALLAQARGILDTCTAENRSILTEDESTRHAELLGQRAALATQIDTVDVALRALQVEADEEQRLQSGEQQRTPTPGVPAGGQLRTSERPTGLYRKDGETSFFRDLYRATVKNDRGSHERLDTHMQEMRAISTGAGTGGEMIPPGWLLDDLITPIRAGRVASNEVVKRPLPKGLDVINVPAISTGTSTAEQTENSNFSETDLTTSSIAANVTTVGGVATSSIQLLEQSPMNVDEVIAQDLSEDLDQTIETFVLTRNASGKYGLLNVPSSNAVTYTDGTPTVLELLPKLISGAIKVSRGRNLPADKMFMSPEMWGWIVASQDPNGRPLVLTADAGPFNAQGIDAGNGFRPGYAGRIAANMLPVFLTPALPQNLGSGTNETHVPIIRSTDVRLYEGTPVAEVFRETQAKAGQVVFRLYEFLAFMANRTPKSISVVSGTGTIVPAL